MLDAMSADLSPVVADQPFPLLFATVSGAHLYGFPSRDSDIDLRGAHLLRPRCRCSRRRTTHWTTSSYGAGR